MKMSSSHVGNYTIISDDRDDEDRERYVGKTEPRAAREADGGGLGRVATLVKERTAVASPATTRSVMTRHQASDSRRVAARSHLRGLKA